MTTITKNNKKKTERKKIFVNYKQKDYKTKRITRKKGEKKKEEKKS